MLFSRLRPIRPQVEHRDHIDSCAALCRVPEECPEEVDAIINACRRLDPNERPTALEVCSVIENSAPRRPESAPSGMQEGTHTLSVGGGELEVNAETSFWQGTVTSMSSLPMVLE